MSKTFIYTGGYSLEKQLASGETVPAACPGIIHCVWDEDKQLPVRNAVPAFEKNPTWILADPDAPYLYAVNEVGDMEGVEGGCVCAYKIDPENGGLTYLNRQFTTGSDPCHLCFSPDKKYLISANYSGGCVSVFPILDDHSLGHASCVLRHTGSGPNAERQQGPHPHQILQAPDKKHVFAVDLGLDTLISYLMTPEGWLVRDGYPDVAGIKGQGTRHAVFSVDGRKLYVMTEMTSEVNVYDYDPVSGENRLLQTVSAMGPYTIEDDTLGAEIHLHPNGKYLYCSVRGTNHLAVFDVSEDGTISLKQIIGSAGEIPRDFIVWEGGETLLTGNQDTGTVGVYRIDQENGCLTLEETVENIGGVITLAVWKG